MLHRLEAVDHGFHTGAGQFVAFDELGALGGHGLLLRPQRTVLLLQPLDAADEFLDAILQTFKILIYRLLWARFQHAATIVPGAGPVNLPPPGGGCGIIAAFESPWFTEPRRGAPGPPSIYMSRRTAPARIVPPTEQALMPQPRHPDFLELDQVLARADAAAGAAEVHGLLCGLWCSAGRVDEGLWLAQVFEDADPQNVSVQQGRAAVQALADWTVPALNDPVLGMDLLLPADSEPLADRIAALGEWCQGFLLGLAAGGIVQDTPLPDDVAELIRDFTEISRAGFDVEAGDEEDEDALAQIIEYVRVGVLLINDELQPTGAAPRLQ